MTFRRWQWLVAGAVAVAVVAAAVRIVPGEQPHSAGASVALVRLSAAPLGVNVAPWDAVVYAGRGASITRPLLSAAGIKQIRYGGGSYADYYDWQTNTSIRNCLPSNPDASFKSRCSLKDPLGFAQFSQQARAIGADSFITVNYGSGTPALAAAWVTAAARAPSQHVALWEVGNESYGCYEVNNELLRPPARYKGYRPAMGSASGNYQTCPPTTEGRNAGTKTLATSYATNALPFLKAMKKADPSAVIGVPWAFESPVTDSDDWNSTVLGTDGADVNFVDAHYYPFHFSGSPGGANPSDSRLLQALRSIPSLYASIGTELAKYDSHAAVVIGETAASSGPTTTVCTPVGAVFAAGDTLSWLAAGAWSVDWWDLNNDGNTGSSCVRPDFGMFTSSARPTAETPYYGYLLASVLARPGAKMGFLTTSDAANVLAYQAMLPSGKRAVAFINLGTTAAQNVTFLPPSGWTGTLRSLAYSAGSQNVTQSEIITGTTPAVSSMSLPAESITVLET